MNKCNHSKIQKVYPKEPLIISSPLRNNNAILPPLDQTNASFSVTKIIQTKPIETT